MTPTTAGGIRDQKAEGRPEPTHITVLKEGAEPSWMALPEAL